MSEGISLIPLFSGSTGNCTLVTGGDTKILIDAGVSSLKLCCALDSLGVDIQDISAIFITHEHDDHIKALPVLMKNHDLPVYMTESSYLASPLKFSVNYIDPGEKITVGDIEITPFPVSHDTAFCVGYTVRSGGHTAGIMTDTGYVTDEAVYCLSGCESVLIESNHDVGMLQNGSYPYFLKKRILSERGHLSNDACAEFCSFLHEKGTESFILAHLSRENNTPTKAIECARLALGDGVDIVCAPESII